MKYRTLIDHNQKLVLHIHRHPFVLLTTILILLVMALAPPLIVLFTKIDDTLIISQSLADWIAVGSGTYYLFLTVLGLVLWMDYYYDMYIVTEEQILDIDQSSLLSQKISRTSLMRVQDVTAHVKGFWGNLLDFGSLTVQTAGHEKELILEDVPHPREVATRIMQLHDDLIAKESRTKEVGEAEGVHPPGR